MAKRKMAKVKTTIYKTKDRAKGTPLKTWGELKWSGRVSSSCSTCGPVVLPLLQTRWYVMNRSFNFGHFSFGHYVLAIMFSVPLQLAASGYLIIIFFFPPLYNMTDTRHVHVYVFSYLLFYSEYINASS
jgi:hypothetical protein